MTDAKREALAHVAKFSNYGEHSRYFWKPAAMKQLAAAGLVYWVNDAEGGYRITEAGKAALEGGE